MYTYISVYTFTFATCFDRYFNLDFASTAF